MALTKLEEIVKEYRRLIPVVRIKRSKVQRSLERLNENIQDAEEKNKKATEDIGRLEASLQAARLKRRRQELNDSEKEYGMLCRILLCLTTPEFKRGQLDGIAYSFFAKKEEEGREIFSRYRKVYLSDSPSVYKECMLCSEQHPLIYAARHEDEISLESDPYKGAWREKTGKVFVCSFLLSICNNKARISSKEELPKVFEENYSIIFQEVNNGMH